MKTLPEGKEGEALLFISYSMVTTPVPTLFPKWVGANLQQFSHQKKERKL